MAFFREWVVWFALRLLDWAVPAPTPDEEKAEIIAVVRQVCADVGLDPAAMGHSTNLLATGRLDAILHHAGERLGKDVQLHTFGDVVAWLYEAPSKVG